MKISVKTLFFVACLTPVLILWAALLPSVVSRCQGTPAALFADEAPKPKSIDTYLLETARMLRDENARLGRQRNRAWAEAANAGYDLRRCRALVPKNRKPRDCSKHKGRARFACALTDHALDFWNCAETATGGKGQPWLVTVSGRDKKPRFFRCWNKEGPR